MEQKTNKQKSRENYICDMYKSEKCIAIDLFSLYVLFSHFKPRDATRGNSFFQMSSYASANVRITNEKNKRKIPMRASRGLKWENKMYKPKRSITSSAYAPTQGTGLENSSLKMIFQVSN